jgi:hypothetical protein
MGVFLAPFLMMQNEAPTDGVVATDHGRTSGVGPMRYRGSPSNDHLHLTHILSKIQSSYLKMDNISYNDRIELTITNLES